MKALRTFGIVLLFIGLGLFILGAILTKGDLSKITGIFLNDDQYEIVEKKGEEEITSVDLSLITNDIIIYKSTDETYAADYYVSEDDTIDFSIVDKQLVMKGNKKNEFFNWGIKSPKVSKVNLYLPKSFDGIINIKSITGDVKISDTTLQELNIESNTGNITISKVDIVSGLKFLLNTGDIKLDMVNTTFIDGKSSTGRIEILNSVVTTKIDVKTSTGNISLDSVNCGKVTCKASTGNIKIKLVGPKEDYHLELETSIGDIFLEGNIMSDHVTTPYGAKSIDASTSTGDITINFS
jgi:hypothetical protein